MRSFRSPTRKQRSEIDELDNPLLTRSFDTLTSVGSAPTSAPSTQSLWQEAPFPQYSPMGLYPYAKQHSEFPSSFSGYMTLPPDYSMFTAVEPFAGCQEDSGMSANCSHILGNARHEEESLTMSVDERFDDTCETRDVCIVPPDELAMLIGITEPWQRGGDAGSLTSADQPCYSGVKLTC